MINYKVKIKQNKGITLIALVITIIVLLILAAVSIATLAGENGILSNAKKAKEKNDEAILDEEGTLSNYEEVLEEYANPEKKLMKLIVNSGENKSVALPIIPNSENNFTIDWGDGTIEKPNSDEYITHTYQDADIEYMITIDGTVKEIDTFPLQWYVSYTMKNKIIEVKQWGNLGLTRVSFGGWTNLVDIASPEKNSFTDVTNFNAFLEGTGIKRIPENLFANCSNVTDFALAFSSTEITSIPENLFANCPNVENFKNTFSGTNITSIPENLFVNCPNVTDFSDTFAATEITKIPENLFANCTNVENFKNTFADCINLKGSAIQLWTRGTNDSSNDYKGTPNGGGCFYNATQLDNYDQIPSYWKEELDEGK